MRELWWVMEAYDSLSGCMTTYILLKLFELYT
jgi:hypothetical protein